MQNLFSCTFIDIDVKYIVENVCRNWSTLLVYWTFHLVPL